MSEDTINRQVAIDAFYKYPNINWTTLDILTKINALPSAHSEIIRCKDCKHWRQQTNYQGVPLPFGLCESDDMWRSLYGETYEVAHIDADEDFYCGYAERKINE